MSYALFIAHTLYKLLSLVGGFLFLRNAIPLHQVLIHGFVTGAAVTTVLWYYLLFVKYPVAYTATFQMTKICKHHIMRESRKLYSRNITRI